MTTQRIHILGIGGTFMSALAVIAREAGFYVTGSDANCYPPVSELLQRQAIRWTEGYDDVQDALNADCVIVGNALKRGTPVIEAILNAHIPYTSGPQWLADNVLHRYRVIAVAGTHGKTTTTAMLAYILQYAKKEPSFLIGGVATDFNTSARLGHGEWFVIEADEYDSAFFDKRPKFMHYRPDIAILNNLEFDHADIYEDVDAIQRQFHYFLKTIPSEGVVLKPRDDEAINCVLKQGLFSHMETMACSGDADWIAQVLDDSGQSFRIWFQGTCVADINWSLIGQFNIENALSAMAASVHAGVEPQIAAIALESFSPVKKRLEIKSKNHDITIYDDFAHHPTAIQKTIAALHDSARHQRILVVIEFASYSMRMGFHAAQLSLAFIQADRIYALNPKEFSINEIAKNWHQPYQVHETLDALINALLTDVQKGDAILVMSNRGFGNIHQRLSQGVEKKYA